MTPTIRSLCTGYGGLDFAVEKLFHGRVVEYSDIEPGPIAVMTHHHPNIPNLGDVKNINPFLLTPTEILCGGYPCQPFSNAGKRLGIDDPRHIWPWIFSIIGATRPRVVVLENVASHLRRGFDVVAADLARLGYMFAWSVVRADTVGAPHQRKRLFVIAVAEDAYLKLGDQRRPTTSGQTETGWTWPDLGRRGDVLAANAALEATSDALGVGRDQRRSEHARLVGRSGPAYGRVQPEKWGAYAAAIARWESVLGLSAPPPTVMGKRGGQVLSPYFVEWMMGLKPGHVTDVPGLTRNQQLRLLGNGVVEQQALYAISGLWERLMNYRTELAA
jgi:DNA (cytosine-5)-methyltransferase 1